MSSQKLHCASPFNWADIMIWHWPPAATRPRPDHGLTLHAQDIKFDLTTLSATMGQPITLTYISKAC
jgi:hypothetical protein